MTPLVWVVPLPAVFSLHPEFSSTSELLMYCNYLLSGLLPIQISGYPTFWPQDPFILLKINELQRGLVCVWSIPINTYH